jgi:hypothetical protein
MSIIIYLEDMNTKVPIEFLTLILRDYGNLQLGIDFLIRLSEIIVIDFLIRKNYSVRPYISNYVISLKALRKEIRNPSKIKN